MAKQKKIIRSPRQESFNELCRFADESGLQVEIEKPFRQFDNLIINIVDRSNKKMVEQVIIDDITFLNRKSAKILKDLTK